MILLAEGLWIYGTSHISVLSEMCCKCFRYRLALAFKQFGTVSHWIQTGNSIFVFTVQLLVLFPEGRHPLCHSYFHTWHQGKTFYSMTIIGLWNKTKEGITLLIGGFIGHLFFFHSLWALVQVLFHSLLLERLTVLSNSWVILNFFFVLILFQFSPIKMDKYLINIIYSIYLDR